MNPDYPLYVISKGRSESRQTIKALERLNVPYFLVIEPQEFELYAKHVDARKILILPFQNLGQGSIPARNWVWEHSIGLGAKRHWILDDNIENFYRLNRNIRHRVMSGTIFKAAEDFVDRYENIGIAGFNYRTFCRPEEEWPPFYLNTRVYSCMLLDNSMKLRWRGRYNEDTDLSINILKSGMCSILFNAFLIGKCGTMRMKGGNTDELYAGDGRLKMAESLVNQHPEITKITEKWGRAQHHVDYRPFKKNKLIFKRNVVLSNKINEYGMILTDR